MIAVITGDIINSRTSQTQDWLKYLKSVLNQYGQSPKQWEIFRGDSFQLVIKPENALFAAIHIKAAVKQTKTQDVRMAIGLGEETNTEKKITESYGSAYIRSGECFDALKKQTLAIKSSDEQWNNLFNLLLSLALLTANTWTGIVAQVITTVLENPEKHQTEIAKLINKSQSSISEALKRGGYEEIMKLNSYYQTQLPKL